MWTRRGLIASGGALAGSEALAQGIPGLAPFWPARLPAVLSYRAAPANLTSGTIDLGTTAADRVVIVMYGGCAPTGITVNGVALTLYANTSTTGVAVGLVPAGGSVSWSTSGVSAGGNGSGSNSPNFAFYTATGLMSRVPTLANGATTQPSGGFLLGEQITTSPSFAAPFVSDADTPWSNGTHYAFAHTPPAASGQPVAASFFTAAFA